MMERGPAWKEITDIIMDRAKGLDFRFDRLGARAMLARLYRTEIRFIPAEVASLPDAKLAEWWEANIARPDTLSRQATPKRSLKR